MNNPQNARFVLVIAETEKDEHEHEDKGIWQNFLLNVQKKVLKSPNIEWIHDNVWLINLENELPALAELIQQSAARSIHIRLLFLAESPDWIKYPPATKPAGEV